MCVCVLVCACLCVRLRGVASIMSCLDQIKTWSTSGLHNYFDYFQLIFVSMCPNYLYSLATFGSSGRWRSGGRLCTAAGGWSADSAPAPAAGAAAGTLLCIKFL